jgi:hypothetical protein
MDGMGNVATTTTFEVNEAELRSAKARGPVRATLTTAPPSSLSHWVIASESRPHSHNTYTRHNHDDPPQIRSLDAACGRPPIALAACASPRPPRDRRSQPRHGCWHLEGAACHFGGAPCHVSQQSADFDSRRCRHGQQGGCCPGHAPQPGLQRGCGLQNLVREAGKENRLTRPYADTAGSSFSPIPKRVMNGSEPGLDTPAAVLSGAPTDLQARTVRYV